MPTIANFLASDRPTAIADLIALKPTSIVVRRGSSTLAAQTVRLETLASQRQVSGPGGVTHSIDAHLLGYKGHGTIADTDIQAGDRFVDDDGLAYEVIAVTAGQVGNFQAYLKVRS
jgi:hypothetical protein